MKDQTDADGRPTVEHYRGFEFRYGVDRRALGAQFTRAFVPSTLTEAARRFVDRSIQAPHGAARTRLHRMLGRVLSDFDVNGLLGMYPLHLLDSAGFERLLGRNHAGLLDVGAGNGDVTRELLPLAARVQVAERSWAMRRVLRQRGFEVVGESTAADGTFAVVSCLNVLDRTDRPRTLLRDLADRVAPGGKLMLSMPLPLDPFFYRGGRTHEPVEPLPSGPTSWERSFELLQEWLHAALPDWSTRCFTRTPYLSGGDAQRTLYVLDAVVLVLEREPTVQSKKPDQSVEPAAGTALA